MFPNRKIFDIYASDTFNQLELRFLGEVEKPKQFPPWLKLPSYYTTDLWRRVIVYQDGLMYLKTIYETIRLRLECNHFIMIDEIKFQMHNKNTNRIRVNCSECGGTGEVRFL